MVPGTSSSPVPGGEAVLRQVRLPLLATLPPSYNLPGVDLKLFRPALPCQVAAIGDIRFVEWPDPETLVRYYNAADLFVSVGVNRYETCGRSPAEAMACGTPSVVSAFNGFRDTSADWVPGADRAQGRKGWPQRPHVGRFAATG